MLMHVEKTNFISIDVRHYFLIINSAFDSIPLETNLVRIIVDYTFIVILSTITKDQSYSLNFNYVNSKQSHPGQKMEYSQKINKYKPQWCHCDDGMFELYDKFYDKFYDKCINRNEFIIRHNTIKKKMENCSLCRPKLKHIVKMNKIFKCPDNDHTYIKKIIQMPNNVNIEISCFS
jgi:hypothetical protein